MGHYRGPERRRPVLIVQHAQHEHPAALKRALETQGIQSHWIHPYRGEPFPNASEIRGMISLGGPMSANDDLLHPWIAKECELLRQCVDEGIPVAGICLGGQMLARAMGGKVERHAIAEIGWHSIQVNALGESDPVVGAAGPSPTVYQWHQDTFHLPRGAELLAGSIHCDRQAYRIGDKTYGFQFHPEADHQLVNEWLAIEGTEDDISEARKLHGTRTIQDGSTQRVLAIDGEKSSLRITAAISQLFRNKDYSSIACGDYERIEEWAVLQREVELAFESPERRKVLLRGTIATLATIPNGEFMMLKDPTSLVWPIRLDQILTIKEA